MRTKNLKISKGYSETVNRRIGSTMDNRKRTNNDLQNTTEKTKIWATWTPWKLGMNPGTSVNISSSWFSSGIRGATHIKNLVIRHDRGKGGILPWQTHNIRSHLWHRHSVTVNQVMMATVRMPLCKVIFRSSLLYLFDFLLNWKMSYVFFSCVLWQQTLIHIYFYLVVL